MCVVAGWHESIAVFIPVCFVCPDDDSTLPTTDKSYMFQYHDDQRYVVVRTCAMLFLKKSLLDYRKLVAHALALLALSAARCEQCRFVPEMIA